MKRRSYSSAAYSSIEGEGEFLSTRPQLASAREATRVVPVLSTLMAVALTIAACSGGGGSRGDGNAPPALGALTAQTVDQDTPTAAQSFTVTDEAGADGVTLTAASSDTKIVPLDGISISGSSGIRSVIVTPAEDATGMATVTINAMDAQGATSSTAFLMTVNAVPRSFTAAANAAFSQSDGDMPTKVSGFTFTQDADDEATFSSLLQ